MAFLQSGIFLGKNSNIYKAYAEYSMVTSDKIRAYAGTLSDDNEKEKLIAMAKTIDGILQENNAKLDTTQKLIKSFGGNVFNIIPRYSIEGIGQ